jgi:hypothetical protein
MLHTRRHGGTNRYSCNQSGVFSHLPMMSGRKRQPTGTTLKIASDAPLIRSGHCNRICTWIA